MSIIMDRVFDLSAVDWPEMDPAVLNRWELEALDHHPDCRCQKCALFFARMPAGIDVPGSACAIPDQVIDVLREILNDCGKR